MRSIYTLFCMLLSSYIIAAPPTIPSSNPYFSINGTFFNIGWDAGNGAKRIVIAKAGSPVTAVPQDGIDYEENSVFGAGQEIAPGEFVVHDNVSTSFFLTGLTPATTYYFAFFEYNGTGASIEYLTSSFLAVSASTAAAPTVQASNMVFTNITGNTVDLEITPGNGTYRLILAREGEAVNADPEDLTAYGASATFGNGSEVGTGNFSVYSSNGNSTRVYGLKPGTEYYFAVYEFNGLSEPVYKKPAYTASVTTRAAPTEASSGINFITVDGQELRFGWTSGNGLRRIIIAKEGSDVTAVPADGTDYTADPVFGNGTAIAPGEFVVYNDNFNETTVQGLNPATTYYFRIYEYDGTGNETIYLTTLFGSASSSTAVTPTVQASGLVAENVTSTSLSLGWTAGNGDGRLVVARQGEPVNITPEDLTAYDANSGFGNGQEIGSGNFVVNFYLEEGLVVSNLLPNTTYYFAVYEYNGLNQPLYLSPAATLSVTTMNALTVKLSQWKVINNNAKIQLQWTTASEENTSRFNVLRSTDGIHFTSILSVPAKGNSNVPVNYTADDINPFGGRSYYKLEMVDQDGHKEYSGVINISFVAIARLFHIRATHVHEKLQVDFAGNITSENNQWRIINERGQSVTMGSISYNNLEVNTSSLPAGIYWFQMQSKTKTESQVFVRE